jgi:hypothetical protein
LSQLLCDTKLGAVVRNFKSHIAFGEKRVERSWGFKVEDLADPQTTRPPLISDKQTCLTRLHPMLFILSTERVSPSLLWVAVRFS